MSKRILAIGKAWEKQPLILLLIFAGTFAEQPLLAKSPAKTNVKAASAAPAEGSDQTFTLPPIEQLASELKVTPKELPVLTETFATALSAGAQSKAYRLLCTKQGDACALLNDFFVQQDQLRRERRNAERRQAKQRSFKVRTDQVEEAQRMPYLNLVQRMIVKDEQELAGIANEVFRTRGCPRNLSAALAIRAEEYFPGSTARTLAKQLFEHAKECIGSQDEAFERLYLRQALYALYDGNRERAEQLLEKARDAKISQEKYRILYWLGKIAEGRGVKPEKNIRWLELVAQFPLSFYSIIACTAMGRDPMQVVTNQKVGGVSRTSAKDPDLTASIRWLEALYAYKKSSAVAKWASWIVKDAGDIEVEVLQYVSTIKLAAGLYRSNISTLFNYFKAHPSELNQEGLKLLYPRPYYDLVSEASRNKIDAFLVFGLMRQESAFDSQAVSRARAKGLMQIIPQTARSLAFNGHRKLLNERDNTIMGVRYLVNLAERFNGKMELVLAGYNAGPFKVDEWLKRNPDRTDPLLWNDLIPYMETRDYVASILRNNYFYTRIYGKPPEQARQLASAPPIYSSEIVMQLLLVKR